MIDMVDKSKVFYDPIINQHCIKEGSKTYIYSIQDEKVVSDGFHSIYFENGGLKGQLGASVCNVTYDDHSYHITDKQRMDMYKQEDDLLKGIFIRW